MLSLLFAQFKGYLLGIGLVLAALTATWFGGRKSAKTDTKVKQLEDEVRAHETRSEVDKRAAAERDARQRLWEDWHE